MQVLAKKQEKVPRRARSTRYRTNLIRFAFLVPAILYLLLFFGYPLYYSFSVSFERYDLQAEVTGSGPFIGLGNYISVFHDSVFLQSIMHTVLFTFFSFI